MRLLKLVSSERRKLTTPPEMPWVVNSPDEAMLPFRLPLPNCSSPKTDNWPAAPTLISPSLICL